MADVARSFPKFSFRAIAVALFFAALWIGLWWQLSGEWSVNDQYSYGWFVPFFAIVLFWLRWEDARSADIRGHKSEVRGHESDVRGRTSEVGNQKTDDEERITDKPRARAIAIGVAIVALLILFPIRLFEIGNPDWRPLDWLHAFCVVAITLVFLWSVGDKPWLRHFAFPVAFTLIAVPWVTPIEEPIVQGLMRIVAGIASETAALFGIPNVVEGNLIRIPGGLLGVNEACSGVRSLQTSLMIGLLFGELKRLSILRRVVLVIAAAAIAFVGNCIRAFVLVWVAATNNVAATVRWHDFAGYGIVVLVFVGSMLLAWLLGRRKLESRKAKVENAERRNFYFLLPTSYFACALSWILAVEVGAHAWYRAHEKNLAETTHWEVQWPSGAPNFHEIKIDEDVRRALRFDSGRAASWSVPAPESTDSMNSTKKSLSCTAYFFRWNSGKNSALLANLHRPDVCLPAIGWKQTADTGVNNYPIAENLSLPFRQFTFRHGSVEQPSQQTAHAFYCLWEDRVPRNDVASQLPEMATSPSAWTRGERLRVVLEGRRHLGQQVLEIVIGGRGELDRQQVEAKFAEIVPQLVKPGER